MQINKCVILIKKLLKIIDNFIDCAIAIRINGESIGQISLFHSGCECIIVVTGIIPDAHHKSKQEMIFSTTTMGQQSNITIYSSDR